MCEEKVSKLRGTRRTRSHDSVKMIKIVRKREVKILKSKKFRMYESLYEYE